MISRNCYLTTIINHKNVREFCDSKLKNRALASLRAFFSRKGERARFSTLYILPSEFKNMVPVQYILKL